MAEARGRFEWNQTSALLALMVNLVRDPRRGSPARPSDFNPFAERPPVPVLRGRDLSILKDVFCHADARVQARTMKGTAHVRCQ